LIDDSDTKILLHRYAVASRVLVSDLIDIDKLENHFLIIAASLGYQILKTYSLQIEGEPENSALTAANIADFFFKILNGSIGSGGGNCRWHPGGGPGKSVSATNHGLSPPWAA
jgi:hypothetical protein